MLMFSYMNDSYIIVETSFIFTSGGISFGTLLDRLEVSEGLLYVFDNSSSTPWVFEIEHMENIKWN